MVNSKWAVVLFLQIIPSYIKKKGFHEATHRIEKKFIKLNMFAAREVYCL